MTMSVEQLVTDLLDPREEAVQFYCKMTDGDPMLPESFVRDWAAVKLHECHG